MAKEKDPYQFEDITDSLTDRQMLFCMHYVGECKFNGAKAAEMAGYEPKNAASYAVYLLKNPNISQFIESLKNDLGRRIGISAEMIAQEMAKLAFFNIKDIMTVDGGIKPVFTMEDKDSAAISSIEVFEEKAKDTGEVLGYVKKVKLADKQRALEGLNVMLGYNKPTTQVIKHDGVKSITFE